MGWFFPSDDNGQMRAQAAASRAAQEAGEPKAVNVADLEIGKLDCVGDTVLVFYGRKPPDFAVYQTENRVSVQFADDKTEADSQRKAIATLNPVRGQINGLIDGWRLRPTQDPRYRRAMRFDRRVGDALVKAFEEDVPDAATILAEIKQDVIDERTALARFEYLVAAFLVGCAMIGLACLIGSSHPDRGGWLWAAAAGGAVGAFFSIAIGIRSRTILTDLLWLANLMDAVLRMVIGMIGASVLYALLYLQLVKISFGGTLINPQPGGTMWLMVIVIGFVAGFSERLVPDLLAQAVAKPADPPLPPRRDAEKQPAAKRAATAAAAAAAAAAPGPAADDIDPAPEQANLDHCACGVDVPDGEASRDEDLPAASGGVVVPATPTS